MPKFDQTPAILLGKNQKNTVMKKIVKNTIVGVGLSIALVACNVGEMDSTAKSEAFQENQTHTSNVNSRIAKERAYGNANQGDFNREMQAFANRKLIRSGNVKFETKNIQQTEADIKWAVRKLGGFISFEQQTRNEWSIRTDIEIRMPSSTFEEMLDSVCSGAYSIDQKNIKVQDVTEQYVDTEARIATRKMVEQKYIQHLAKAKDIEDVLTIETKIGQIREEIESAEKRLRRLKDQVSLSTLHVEFYEQIKKQDKEAPNRFGKALHSGWAGLENFLVVITAIWPVLMIGAIVFLVIRRYRSKRD
ncbi:MAG: hypothetical protein CMD20_02300 [Flavobacteriales bacterium]|nr:hypothetical protein [Flavobacteriales bacterium]